VFERDLEEDSPKLHEVAGGAHSDREGMSRENRYRILGNPSLQDHIPGACAVQQSAGSVQVVI
jgi:hypothetical protein